MARCPPRLLPRTHLDQQFGPPTERRRNRLVDQRRAKEEGEKEQEDNQRQVFLL